MTELIPGEAGIGDEQVAASAPLVRALAVQRLEMIWRSCEPHINLTQDDVDLGRRPDPRFIEAGIRVIDRLAGIYGLLKPAHSAAQEDTRSLATTRLAVEDALRQLERKVHEGETG